MICAINARSSGIAAAVETAAHGDGSVARLWERMRDNHRSGVRWAAHTLLTKPGVRPGLTPPEAEEIVFLAMSFGRYRALVRERGLAPAEVVAFVRRCYHRMLSAPAPAPRRAPAAPC